MHGQSVYHTHDTQGRIRGKSEHQNNSKRVLWKIQNKGTWALYRLNNSKKYLTIYSANALAVMYLDKTHPTLDQRIITNHIPIAWYIYIYI